MILSDDVKILIKMGGGSESLVKRLGWFCNYHGYLREPLVMHCKEEEYFRDWRSEKSVGLLVGSDVYTGFNDKRRVYFVRLKFLSRDIRLNCRKL